jgi:hypothetical protein
MTTNDPRTPDPVAPASRWGNTRTERLSAKEAAERKQFESLDHGFDAFIEKVEELLPRDSVTNEPVLNKADLATAEALLKHIQQFDAGTSQATPTDDTTTDDGASRGTKSAVSRYLRRPGSGRGARV